MHLSNIKRMNDMQDLQVAYRRMLVKQQETFAAELERARRAVQGMSAGPSVHAGAFETGPIQAGAIQTPAQFIVTNSHLMNTLNFHNMMAHGHRQQQLGLEHGRVGEGVFATKPEQDLGAAALVSSRPRARFGHQRSSSYCLAHADVVPPAKKRT